MVTSKEATILCNELFQHPSNFWDNQQNKRSCMYPDFIHKETGKALWIHRCYNPPCIREKLKGLLLFDAKIVENEVPKVKIRDRSRVWNLKCCQKEKNIWKARSIHANLLEENMIARDDRIATSLITTYAKCGALEEARIAFEKVLVHDVVSWSALIAGYAQNGLGNEALECFTHMRKSGIRPNEVTYICILKACGIVGSLWIGEEIEVEIRNQGLLEKNIGLGTALVDMYSKCCAMERAQNVFEKLPMWDIVTWNALIAGYARNGFDDATMRCFRQMETAGIRPDAVTYTCILKACGISRSLEIGEYIDAEARKQGLLQKDNMLGTALMNMYSMCGALEKAREVFEQLPVWDIVSWSAMIAGYAQNGRGDQALTCYRRMKDAGASPNAITYISILKACGMVGSLEIGEDIHAELRKKGLLQNDIVLGNALMDMYFKCGSVEKAQEVFKQLPYQNIVSWSTLMAGYVQKGLAYEALESFRQMKNTGIHPDVITYACILKACGIVQSSEIGEVIDSEVRKNGLLQKDVVLGNALVDMYSKCGSLKKAQEVFEQLPVRDVVSWNTMITGYSQNGMGDVALKCFHKMGNEGISPNTVTYVCILKICGILGSIEIGEDIDVEIRKKGLLQKDVVLNNALIHMYFKCGQPEKAREVFEQLTIRDIVSWNSLITGYVLNGLGDEALSCFGQIENEEICPDVVTYACVLKACAIVGSLEICADIEGQVRRQGFLEKNVMVSNALISMYSKCGMLEKARQVFEQIPVQDVVSWNAIITGHVQNGFTSEALKFFFRMESEGALADEVTYICILKACCTVESLEIGQTIDAKVREQGLLEKNVILGNALVRMYSECGAPEAARDVFESLPLRDTVSWNALVAGYIQNGLCDEALKFFLSMQNEGVCPDVITYIYILKICGIIASLEIGEFIDAKIRTQGLLDEEVVLPNALVHMYSECGAIEKARSVFEMIPVRDVVSWNALITGYTHNGLGHVALECFREMQNEGVCPNVVTYVCILKACGIVGSLGTGEVIDAEVREQGLLNNDVVLGNALVDMYAKCGMLKKAQEVFKELPERNVVSWIALIAGYGQSGHGNLILDIYNRMRTEDVVPNLATFNVLLNACSHAGLLEEGEKFFDEMYAVYCLTPQIEHYTCMIDLFGRAGCLEKVKILLDKAPNSDHLPFFRSILGSCRKWRNVKLGRWAFEQLIWLDEKCAAAYVCMRNIYAAGGMQTEADRSEALREKNKAENI